jgi:hypothetical protein
VTVELECGCIAYPWAEREHMINRDLLRDLLHVLGGGSVVQERLDARVAKHVRVILDRELDVQRDGRDPGPHPSVDRERELDGVVHGDSNPIARAEPERPQGLADRANLADDLREVHAQVAVDQRGIMREALGEPVDHVSECASVHGCSWL